MTQEKELLTSLITRNKLPRLQTGQILCWYSNLAEIGNHNTTLSSLLPGEELQKAQLFSSERLGKRYRFSHGLLRLLLAHYCEVEADLVQMSVNSVGKPVLSNQKLLFNLSHSDDGCCIALSSSSNVGIDLEKIRKLDDLDLLIDANFGEQEINYVRGKGNESLRRFFQLWTVKESYLKYTGQGMRQDPKQIEFSCTNMGFQLKKVNGLLENFGVETVPLSLEQGYVGAISYETGMQLVPPIQLDLL